MLEGFNFQVEKRGPGEEKNLVASVQELGVASVQESPVTARRRLDHDVDAI